ncbi:MAG: Rab family GTPase [Promethearchaeota archaeon]
MTPEQLPTAKVLVAGATKVGKTSLVNSLVFLNFFDVSPTIGVNFAQKTIVGEDGPLNLSIWDLSGQERFRFLMPQLCGGAAGIVLVFDQTRPASLKKAGKWLKFASKFARPSYQFATVLAGTKADLTSKTSSATIKAFCSEYQVPEYFQCSAKTGENVSEVFTAICSAIQRCTPELVASPNIIRPCQL